MSWSSESTFGGLIDRGVLSIGDGYRAKNAELGGSGPMFLRAGHVSDTHIDFADVDRFQVDLAPKLADKMSKPGDVVITTKGNSTGRTAFVTADMPPFVYSPHLSRWRSLDLDVLDSGFLRYWSRSREFTVQLDGMKLSTDMAPYLSLGDQRRLRITLPEIADQRTIGEVLSSLDDKIELNRRMNRVLEAMARAIFKAWFVNFEPVKAKAAGASCFRGMPQEVFDQLPDQFTESELGPIPRGWQVAALDELFEINPRRTLKKGQNAPYLAMADMPTQGHAPDRWRVRAFGSGMRFENGDTLVARITPCLENGKTAFVDFLPLGTIGWGSTEYIVLRPRPPLPAVYAYCLARLPDFRDFAITNMTGTSGRQRVPASALLHFKIARPTDAIAAAFGDTIEAMFALAASRQNESRTLAAIRDVLLPKLISGEIRVPQAEAAVEEVL